MKHQLRLLLNPPRYGPVALRDPQRLVEVWLHADGTDPLNVTSNNVIAALSPLTIGVMLDTVRLDQPQLRFYQDTRLLGTIHLRLTRTLAIAGRSLALFETRACENHCVSRPLMALYNFLNQRRADARQRRNPHNFRMTPTDLRCNHAFYLCPRPVVLVTVEHQGAQNMFPMDLIGPTDSPYFSMALRNTSPAVRLMQQSRRMALAGVPISLKNAAYQLGEHHRKTTIDWNTLPFKTTPSPHFALPVAQDALSVREVQVEHFETVGSHCLFLTTVQSETGPAPAKSLQLFHAFSSYRGYLHLNADNSRQSS